MAKDDLSKIGLDSGSGRFTMDATTSVASLPWLLDQQMGCLSMTFDELAGLISWFQIQVGTKNCAPGVKEGIMQFLKFWTGDGLSRVFKSAGCTNIVPFSFVNVAVTSQPALWSEVMAPLMECGAVARFLHFRLDEIQKYDNDMIFIRRRWKDRTSELKMRTFIIEMFAHIQRNGLMRFFTDPEYQYRTVILSPVAECIIHKFLSVVKLDRSLRNHNITCISLCFL